MKSGGGGLEFRLERLVAGGLGREKSTSKAWPVYTSFCLVFLLARRRSQIYGNEFIGND